MSQYEVIANQPLATGIFSMVVRAAGDLPAVLPGQFGHIKVPGSDALLLRRPISFNRVDRETRTLEMVYQVKGEGTQRLSTLQPGAAIDMLAPLGRPFAVEPRVRKAAIVGGGIGAAPLMMLLEAYPDVAFDTFLGFRSREFAYQLEEFQALSRRLILCSDDGTLGEQGFVTDALAQAMAAEAYDCVYACGPTPMLRSLQKVMAGNDVPCLVSLEERMGCGHGACLVCNCKIKKGDEWHYRRVCADGPVFPLREVDFNG